MARGGRDSDVDNELPDSPLPEPPLPEPPLRESPAAKASTLARAQPALTADPVAPDAGPAPDATPAQAAPEFSAALTEAPAGAASDPVVPAASAIPVVAYLTAPQIIETSPTLTAEAAPAPAPVPFAADGGSIGSGFGSVLTSWSDSLSRNTSTLPVDAATAVLLAAARREHAAGAVTPAAAAATTVSTGPANPAAAASSDQPVNLTSIAGNLIYNPLHTVIQAWVTSDLGLKVDAVLNALVGSYMIGNGADGTTAAPDGAPGGWLWGDGGKGLDSARAGVAGGKGGAAGAGAAGVSGQAGGNGGAGTVGDYSRGGRRHRQHRRRLVLVKDPAKPLVGDNVNTPKLKAFGQAYPQLVSGVPQNVSYSDNKLEFSYSTQMPDGSGSFAAGSQTTVAVPKINFPNGYQVSVTGGKVVSGPNAPILVIASDAGAGTVSVTVTPVATAV